jgi:predicted Zn-dependent protease
VNLADTSRGRRDTEGEQVLRDVLALDPRSAPAHHALGLLLVRQKRQADAIRELEAAARLAPESARYAYVYAVGLDGTGRRKQAIEVLERSLLHHPNDRDTSPRWSPSRASRVVRARRSSMRGGSPRSSRRTPRRGSS